MEFNTALLHTGMDAKKGTPLEPIYQTTAFQYPTAEELERVFLGTDFGYIYTRISNPTLVAFEKKVAALEKGVGAVACASGMAAVTLSLLSIVQSGQEILSGSGLYGGTLTLFKELQRFGITSRWVTDNNIESFAVHLSWARILFSTQPQNTSMAAETPSEASLWTVADSAGIWPDIRPFRSTASLVLILI